MADLAECKANAEGVMSKKPPILSSLLLLLVLTCAGQQPSADQKDELAQLRLKKQLLVGDLDRQIKDIQPAAVRVWARYKVAGWLWKDGKDESETAEGIAVEGIDDHYRNKELIPPQFLYGIRLLSLLDSHAPDRAKQIRLRYAISPQDDLQLVSDLLNSKNGERRAVDIAVNVLSAQNDKGPDLAGLLMALVSRESGELTRLLAAILAAEASGRIRLSTNNLLMYAGAFAKPSVPLDIRRQFLNLAVFRCRNVAAVSTTDQSACYGVFERLFPDLSAESPEILAEAGPVYTLLSAQITQKTRAANESNERMKSSPDRLGATVAEAEREEDPARKSVLYKSAAYIALTQKKFTYAVDLMEQASEIEIPNQGSKDIRTAIADQFYGDVVVQSLATTEPSAASYAIKKMTDVLARVRGHSKLASYYLEKNDLDSAFRSYDQAVTNAKKVEITPEGIVNLVRMLPAAQKLDTIRVFELTKLIAKSVNSMPSPTVEDRPGTKNYLDYVSSAMMVNYSLQPALAELVKTNRSAVSDLSDLIQKKEIKITAEIVLATNSFDTVPWPTKTTKTAGVTFLVPRIRTAL